MAENTQTSEVQAPEIYAVEKHISPPHSPPPNGGYAVITADNNNNITHHNYVYCREQFHGANNTPLLDLLFVHPEGKGRNVAAFIRMVEERLDHELYTDSGPTNIPTISWFKPADFWRRNAVRRSLFTILLRSGRAFKLRHNNFEEALFSDPYAIDTRPAIEHFLNGNTWIANNAATQLWHRQFSGQNNQQTISVLTKKPVTDAMLLRFCLEKIGLSKSQIIGEFRRTQIPKKFSQKPPKVEPEAPIAAVTDVTPATVNAVEAPPTTSSVVVETPTSPVAHAPVRRSRRGRTVQTTAFST